MDLDIHGRNVTISPRTQSYVERKVGRLDRFMPDIMEVRVDLGEEKSNRAGNRMIAQVTVRHKRGTILRAEERSNDLFAAVDAVVDKLYRQIERYKGKRKRRGGDFQEEFAAYETAIDLEEEDFDTGNVIRRKRFSIIPMSEEEAIEQMELLGHDFFVFVNADTGGVNVIYLRKDGNYGLLEPELG
ncbi:MAG: ribosome-associated translation inhibitor RaiA [Anaerolineae bacterium]|nr:ribosome-associated translation inhibitor RaiA [Anaerolineae bacterium]